MQERDGRERRNRAQGARVEQLTEVMASLDPQLPVWADDFIFGQLWGREGISFEERMLVAITALAATEHTDQLRNYLHGALQDGMSARKIHEALVMMVVYAGFPTALTSLVVWKEVVAAARRRGLELDLGE